MGQQQTLAPVDARVEEAVERICHLGCAGVYRLLDAVDRGERPAALDGLPPDIRSRVILELRSIMAVYDARDGGASCKLDLG